MIVGLGSSIVSTVSPAAGADPANKTFQLSCAEFGVRVPANVSATRGGAEIEKAIGAEIAKRGWSPENSKPGLVILMGGFSGSETPGAGDGRAKSLLPRLRQSTPLLQQVEMRTAGARTVRVNGSATNVGGAGSYLLVTYLLFSGPALSEDCTQ